MDELERFKSEINLTAFAAAKGYRIDRRESSRNCVVMREAATEDKIIVSRDQRDGHWIYFSVRDARDHGTIVDFIQRRGGGNLGAVRRELLPWIGAERTPVAPQLYVPTVERRNVDRARVARVFDEARVVAHSAYPGGGGDRLGQVTESENIGLSEVRWPAENWRLFRLPLRRTSKPRCKRLRPWPPWPVEVALHAHAHDPGPCPSPQLLGGCRRGLIAKPPAEEAGDEPEGLDDADDRQSLPLLREGEAVTCAEIVIADRQTTPPKRLTDASLIQAMTGIARFVDDPKIRQLLRETDGIGTPATQAQIVETLFERHFIEKKGRQVFSTQVGRALVQVLPEITTKPDMTALWEAAMRRIADGSASLSYDRRRFRPNCSSQTYPTSNADRDFT